MADSKPTTESENQPTHETRAFPFEIEEVRDAEGGRSTDFTVKGHAAVFNTWTDLGPFRERVAKGAFDEVLSGDPHVIHTIDHDPGRTLSSTRSNPVTLELRTDPKGLHFWSRADGEVSYAKDLRRNLERGVVNQSSFAFTVADDEWKERTVDGESVIERTITKIGDLFDVTTTAMGAYPTTDSQLASRTLERARAEGRLPDSPPAATTPGADPKDAVEGTDSPPDTGAESEGSSAAQASPVVRKDAKLFALKVRARRELEEAEALRDQLRRKVFPHEDHKADSGSPKGS